MKPVSYLVVYRDSPKSQQLHFGPFVSENIAQFFQASLPMPQTGGWARRVPIQPYQSHEGHVVSQQILRDRRQTVAA
jgi:hypothetical protein